MTFNTGKPVPSTDPRDLYDNAENLDKLINGPDPFYPDRLGKLRESWSGMENSFNNAQEGRETAFTLSQADKESRFQAFLLSSGYVSKGDYAANVVLAERNEYVAVSAVTTGTTAAFYRPSPDATLPLTLTGVWATDEPMLRLLGDDVLRSEILSGGLVTAQMVSGPSDGTVADAIGYVTPEAFGGDPTGSVSSQSAFDACIAAQKLTGVAINVHGGSWLIDGLLLDYDDASVNFVGKVNLIANSDNRILFHQAGSFARHNGTFRTVSNGKAGIWGMACAPFDLTQTTVLTQTNHNRMPGIIGDSGLQLCIGYKSGPRVGTSDSGCFYNEVPFARGEAALGFIKLMGAATPNGAPCNRNKFYNCRTGTRGGTSSNFGVYIEAGDTNQFFGCDFEGVGSGTVRPGELATPTAIKIDNFAPGGQSNNHNTFFGGQMEANTRDLDIGNVRTYFFGTGYSDAKSVFPNGRPLKSLPGRDGSTASTKLLGFRGIDDENIVFEGEDLADWDATAATPGRVNWQTHPLNAANLTQGGTPITSVGQSSSFYSQLAKQVDWHFRVAWRAVAGATALTIPLPKSAQAALYTASGSAQTMRVPLWITNGTTEQPWYGVFADGVLTIPAPAGGWNTTGNVNIVWAQVRYHR